MKKKVIIGVLVVAVVGAIGWANVAFKRTSGVSVTTEKIERRDLESIVSASGKVQPKNSVNISAETMGKVVGVAVNEGDYVKKGQRLLQIDPKNLETSVQNHQASLDAARVMLEQSKAQVENAKLALKQSQDSFKRAEAQMAAGLLARQDYERADNDLKTQTTNLKLSEQSVTSQEQRIKQEEANFQSATYDLTKLTIVSPLDGIVTARNIEEGETAVVGTMNNAGTVLLTVADMSVIETEVEVDETDIPYVKIGQPAKVTIDAIKDKTFMGKVTEVGNSPIPAASGTTRATNFKVTITIDGTVPNVRPGFTCTAVVTTATRQQAVAVPIQAMAMREMIVDASGEIFRAPEPARGTAATGRTGPVELKPGQTRKEIEGVFLLANGRAVFTPIKVGIAGEKFYEVLSGLKAGDDVITGPFQSVRNLKDQDTVKGTASLTPTSTAAPSKN